MKWFGRNNYKDWGPCRMERFAPRKLTSPTPISISFDGMLDGMIAPAINKLILEWKDGFPEAVHRMDFPRSQGFSGEEGQVGDIFQRALIVDTLLDANDANQPQLDDLLPVVDYEIAYLLGQRRLTGGGGWSYFPGLLELPSDADDLAQVLQALVRRGRRAEAKAYCERPLSILLGDNAHSDGSLETWIIPKGRDAESELQHSWAVTAWGTGPDTEVMANLLYAIRLYDKDRFAGAIRSGTQFIASRQEHDGSWKSTWYHGPFYGTWVCVRLLSKTAPDSEALEATWDFLVSRQRSDGGWGSDGEGCPLSTAFALLALAEVTSRRFDPNRIESAIKSLAYGQSADGGWPAVPFIRMELGRPTGRPWHTLTYSSATITTAFVVKALLAWRAERLPFNPGDRGI
jgi:squalene-hopene/tetraprenyl-beta-curcumene cyclase